MVAAVKAAPNNLTRGSPPPRSPSIRPVTTRPTRRVHLNAVPADQRQTLKVKYLEGMIGLIESKPDLTIDASRTGLLSTGGTDDALTAGLAQVLLESGRHAEARPLDRTISPLDRRQSR